MPRFYNIEYKYIIKPFDEAFTIWKKWRKMRKSFDRVVNLIYDIFRSVCRYYLYKDREFGRFKDGCDFCTKFELKIFYREFFNQ